MSILVLQITIPGITPNPASAQSSSFTLTSASPSTMTLGTSVRIDGTLCPNPQSGVTTNVYYTRPDGTKVTTTPSHNPQDFCSGFTVDFYKPDQPGKWTAYAVAYSSGNQLLAQSSSISFTVQGEGFSITVPPSTSVYQGSFTSFGVSISSNNPQPYSALLSVSGLPNGITYSFNPQSSNPPFTSSLTLTASSDAPSGQYTVTVTGNGGGFTASSSFSLTVYPPQKQQSSFSISPSSSLVTVDSYIDITGSINPTPQNGFTTTVHYTRPDGSTFTNNPVHSGGQGSFTVDHFSPDKPGTWSVYAEWGGDDKLLGSQSNTVTFQVASQGFTVYIPSSNIGIYQGQSGNINVNVQSQSNPNYVVTLQPSTSIRGVTFSFSPQSSSPPFSSTLTISATSDAAPMQYTVTLTGTGGGYTSSTNILLNIYRSQPPPQPSLQVTLSGNPSTMQSGGSSTITATTIASDGSIPSVSYSWSATGGSLMPTVSNSETWNAPIVSEQITYRISVTASAAGYVSGSAYVDIVIKPTVQNTLQIITQKPPFNLDSVHFTDETKIGNASMLVKTNADSGGNRENNYGYGDTSVTSWVGGGSALSIHGLTYIFKAPSTGLYEIVWKNTKINYSGDVRRLDPYDFTAGARSSIYVLKEIADQDNNNKIVASETDVLAEGKDPKELLFETVQGTVEKLTLKGITVILGTVNPSGSTLIMESMKVFSPVKQSCNIAKDFSIEFQAIKGKSYGWLLEVVSSSTAASILTGAAGASASATTEFPNEVLIGPVESMPAEMEPVSQCKEELTNPLSKLVAPTQASPSTPTPSTQQPSLTSNPPSPITGEITSSDMNGVNISNIQLVISPSNVHQNQNANAILSFNLRGTFGSIADAIAAHYGEALCPAIFKPIEIVTFDYDITMHQTDWFSDNVGYTHVTRTVTIEGGHSYTGPFCIYSIIDNGNKTPVSPSDLANVLQNSQFSIPIDTTHLKHCILFFCHPDGDYSIYADINVKIKTILSLDQTNSKSTSPQTRLTIN